MTAPLVKVVKGGTYSNTDCVSVTITENIKGIHESAFSFNETNKVVKIESLNIAIAVDAFKFNDTMRHFMITETIVV